MNPGRGFVANRVVAGVDPLRIKVVHGGEDISWAVGLPGQLSNVDTLGSKRLAEPPVGRYVHRDRAGGSGIRVRDPEAKIGRIHPIAEAEHVEGRVARQGRQLHRWHCRPELPDRAEVIAQVFDIQRRDRAYRYAGRAPVVGVRVQRAARPVRVPVDREARRQPRSPRPQSHRESCGEFDALRPVGLGEREMTESEPREGPPAQSSRAWLHTSRTTLPQRRWGGPTSRRELQPRRGGPWPKISRCR